MVAVEWSIDPKQLRADFDKPRYPIKCQPLKHLNPTDKLIIADWLIKFRAAVGEICAIAFSDPVPRAEFRIHFKLAGAGFWDELEGMSEIMFFDDLYAKYLTRYAFINGVVASFIIGHVEWEKEPALARCIRDLPGVPGWGSTGNGKAMYDWLVKHGSTDDAATQELLITEWASLMCESHSIKQGRARTWTVFPNSSSAEDVIDRMAALLDLYEKVPDHRSAPSHVFIKVMVQLLSEDVPSLHDWGTRFIVDLLTGKLSITVTRSAWVADEASTLIRAILPMRSLAFTRVHPEDRAPGALHVHCAGQSGNARNFPPSNRPPFQEKKGGPKDGGLKDKIRFGLCSYCDARGCQNADDPKASMDKCSVFGGCPCRPGASADEVQHVELNRTFLKASGSKYHASPYLKGVERRSNVWQHTKEIAQRSYAHDVSPSRSEARSRSPTSVVTNHEGDPKLAVVNRFDKGVRIGRENRLQVVGKLRTMAAQFLKDGDTTDAAYLYKYADDLNRQDDPNDEDDGAAHNLAAANECIGVFNKLAEVDLFDNGASKGTEGILTDNGSFNMMQGSGRCAVLQSHLPILNLNGGSSAAGEELEVRNKDKADDMGNVKNGMIKSPTSLRYPPGLGFSASCSSDGGTLVGKASEISGGLLGTTSLQPLSSASAKPPLLQIPPKCPKTFPTAGWRGERTPASSGGGVKDFDGQIPASCGRSLPTTKGPLGVTHLPASNHASDDVLAPTAEGEMIDARVFALKARLQRDVVNQRSPEQWRALDDLYARVYSIEVSRSRPKLEPAPGIASRGITMASRLARRLTRFIFDTRSTLGSFLAGVVFAILCTFWLLSPRLRPASADIGALILLHCGHVNMPNLLKHGTILKVAADTRGSSLFDGGGTQIVHENDKGAIPGSWQPDVAGLRLGNDTFIQAFGSGSTFIDSPTKVSNLGKTHWYTALRYAVLIFNIVQSNVTGAAEKMTSTFERFYGTKLCGDHLNVYGAPIRYDVKLHTMGLRERIIDGTYTTNNEKRIIVSIIAALALVAHKSNVPFTIIGNGTEAAHREFVWTLKPMVILKQITSALEVSFPLCSFGVQASLRMTLWVTSELVRSKFVECKHNTHVSSDTLPGLPDASLAQPHCSHSLLCQPRHRRGRLPHRTWQISKTIACLMWWGKATASMRHQQRLLHPNWRWQHKQQCNQQHRAQQQHTSRAASPSTALLATTVWKCLQVLYCCCASVRSSSRAR